MSSHEFKFYPETVVWEITFACNMRCVHCGTSAGKRRDDELTTGESLRLIDELTGLGCKSITISGGEPLLRPDWPFLAAHMRENGLAVYLISNGHALDEAVAGQFRDLGIKRVGISIDGTEPIHNRIRQRPDSFARCLRALDTLRDKGVDSCVVTQVNGWNLDCLDDLHELLTVEDVAALLKVSKSWVYEHTRSRHIPRSERLPHVKVGKYVRFETRALRAFIEKQCRTTT